MRWSNVFGAGGTRTTCRMTSHVLSLPCNHIWPRVSLASTLFAIRSAR